MVCDKSSGFLKHISYISTLSFTLFAVILSFASTLTPVLRTFIDIYISNNVQKNTKLALKFLIWGQKDIEE